MKFTDESEDEEQDNDQNNVSEVQMNLLESDKITIIPAESEVSISTAPILSSHVSNSSDDFSEIDSKNLPASQSDQLISLQKKLLKWKCDKVIDLMINRFERNTSCLNLHVSIDRECLN